MRSQLIEKGSVIAAAPTPLDSAGALHQEGLGHLVSALNRSPISGVAVGTSFGRGSRLGAENWTQLVAAWREGLDSGTILVASAGAPMEVRRPLQVFEAARARAIEAARLGVDLVLVEPPGAVRGQLERDRLILEYHSAVAEAGLPLILSYDREASGGIAYGPEVLAQLLARSEVVGIRIATIDGISTFQQVVALARELAPEKRVISGEERFLGYSLMSGADAALVAIAGIYPQEVNELLEAYFAPDPARFLSLSSKVDEFARPIFRPPVESSSGRILRLLIEQGTLPS